MCIALDRPDIQFPVKASMTDINKPTELTMMRLQRVAMLFKLAPALWLRFNYGGEMQYACATSGADWAGNRAILITALCAIKCLDDMVIGTAAVTECARPLSSGEAELKAIVKAATGCTQTKHIWGNGFGVNLTTNRGQYRRDSSNRHGTESRWRKD